MIQDILSCQSLWSTFLASNRYAADERMAMALAEGKTLTQAAAEAGVHHKTVARRLESADFRELVSKYKREILSRAVAVLADGCSEASAHLRALLQHEDARISLGAAKEIISLSLKARQLEGVERELEELRARVDAMAKQHEEPKDAAAGIPTPPEDG